MSRHHTAKRRESAQRRDKVSHARQDAVGATEQCCTWHSSFDPLPENGHTFVYFCTLMKAPRGSPKGQLTATTNWITGDLWKCPSSHPPPKQQQLFNIPLKKLSRRSCCCSLLEDLVGRCQSGPVLLQTLGECYSNQPDLLHARSQNKIAEPRTSVILR